VQQISVVYFDIDIADLSQGDEIAMPSKLPFYLGELSERLL